MERATMSVRCGKCGKEAQLGPEGHFCPYGCTILPSKRCSVVLTSFGLELMAVEYAAWCRYVEMNLPKKVRFPVHVTASRHNAGYTDVVISSESSYEMILVNEAIELLYAQWRKVTNEHSPEQAARCKAGGGKRYPP